MTRKLIFVIQGYTKMDEMGRLDDACTLELYAKDMEEAIKRAKKIIKKNFYRISNIIEKEENG